MINGSRKRWMKGKGLTGMKGGVGGGMINLTAVKRSGGRRSGGGCVFIIDLVGNMEWV